MSDHKIIKKEVDTLDIDYASGTYLLEQITRLGEKYGLDKIYFTYETYPYSGGEYLAVYAEVLETDDELAARIKKEQQYVSLQEQRELAELERLKKKYGI